MYVVWSSQLGARENHVPEAATLMPDPRARHYWDPDRLAGELFRPALETPGAAWDVWMLFGRGARWPEGGPPEPAWWEHQLGGMPPELRLDPERFADRASKLQREEASGGEARPDREDARPP